MSTRRKFSAELELGKDGRERVEEFAALQHHLKKGPYKTLTTSAAHDRGGGPNRADPAESYQRWHQEQN